MAIKLTEDEISKGIEKLEQRFERTFILIKMVDKYLRRPFFNTNKTLGLCILMGEIYVHVCGQLSRLCFDQHSRNKIASLIVIYNQVSLLSEHKLMRGSKYRRNFKELDTKLVVLCEKNTAIKKFCNKY